VIEAFLVGLLEREPGSNVRQLTKNLERTNLEVDRRLVNSVLYSSDLFTHVDGQPPTWFLASEADARGLRNEPPSTFEAPMRYNPVSIQEILDLL